MFYGDFNDKADVCKGFNISGFDGVVVYATYTYEDYSGSAEVIFVNGGRFYTVSGSHCSCNGLEDQWEPVEMPLDALRKIGKDGQGSYSDAVRAALWVLDDLNVGEASDDVIAVALALAFG